MDTTTAYSWVPYYEKLANALLPYADKRQELIQKLWAAFNERGIKPPTWNQDKTMPSDVDPFSVFCSFNKFKMTDANRMKYASAVAQVLGVTDKIPTGFHGLSLKDARKQAFYGWDALAKDAKDIGNLWDLFKAALKYADEGASPDDFCRIFDQALTQYAVSWSITMGLFWIRPMSFVSLDSTNITYLQQIDGLKERLPDFKHVPSGSVYLDICRNCKDWAAHNGNGLKTLPEISSAAWKYSQENKKPKAPKKVKGAPPEEKGVITGGEPSEENSKQYAKADFLHDVYMSKEKYEETKAALEYKYNIILQGPPGVGKSYAAKRLAYSLMGERDDERICMIQFHHSYSYEDFMQGYRPDKDGKFTLRNGIFYNFCKKAESSDKEYYLIIDEINRGDLNKIFGETFLLMEKDKRGTNTNVKLAYSQEPFSIPDNIRIIGMMNTADRSIALIDHALRRRFAFIDLEPAFGMAAFQDFVQNAPSSKLQNLLKAVISLNDEITGDFSLGKGYRIGHSYFCPPNAAELTDERLNAIVKFELIPLLEEYWFDEPDKVNGWSAQLREAVGLK